MLVLTGLVLESCASLTWNSPVIEGGSAKELTEVIKKAGGKEVATYKLICGFGVGVAKFQGLVVAAVRSGKSITYLKENYYVYQKVTAYAR